MSVRRYDFSEDPREVDLSPELREMLLRNGMQSHINMLPDGRHELVVLGHDSPVLRYPISERQVADLTTWGPTTGHKKAYNTFVDVVKNDFDVPDGYVTASNAFGRVVTGLHGVRLNPGEYGTPRFPLFGHVRGWLGDFLGWGPRSFGHYGSEGWHMRRINDHAYFPSTGGLMVPERPDGRLKPGEMAPGGYGFYYKGQQQVTNPEGLENMQVDFKPIEAAPRPMGEAVPLSEAITSDVYFTNDAFQEVMASHGLVVDKDKKTLTVMSQPTRVNMVYQLTDAELATLTANSVSGKNGVSVDKRIATVNAIIANDFAGKVDKNMLETKNLIDVELKPEVRQEVEAKFIKQDEIMEQKERWRQEQLQRDEEDRKFEEAKQRIVDKYNERSTAIAADKNAVDGREIANLMKNRGWVMARGGDNARELVVGEIRVDYNGKLNGQDSYVMSAELNGQKVPTFITKEQYDRFLAVDDKERLKLFADIYDKDVAIAKMQMPAQPYVVDDRGQVVDREELVIAHSNSLTVNGQDLLANGQSFFRDQSHGREVRVDEIRCERTEDGKYAMVAQIDGREVSKEINQKAYQNWIYSDDGHRFELFDKQFSDIAIKNVNRRNVLDPMNRLDLPMDFAHEGATLKAVDANGEELQVGGIHIAQVAADKYVMSASIDGQTVSRYMSEEGYKQWKTASDGLKTVIFANTFGMNAVLEPKAECSPEKCVESVDVEKSVEGKAVITAVVGGTAYQQEVSAKDYDKMLSLDDRQRGRLVAKLLELNIPSDQTDKLGKEVMASITAGDDSQPQQSQSRPEIYKSETTTEKINVKELAAANYEQMETETQSQTLEETQSRGMGV